jgi:hypothetical protein
MFDFLRSPPNRPAVMTGHANGLITMNVEDADDVKRIGRPELKCRI